MSKGTILSVDDDLDFQVVLKNYLESDGYDVCAANTGQELRDQLTDVGADAILLDLVLPDADGISLITHIRSVTPAPIIVLSGKTDTTEKIVCLEMGADDYLTKPFEMRELTARIKAALRRTGAATPAASPATGRGGAAEPAAQMHINFGSFVLDRNQLQLFDADGRSLNITTGEFQLFEALALAPNKVLTREYLFQLTRDDDYSSYDRAIDIQIGRIRKKLGKDGMNIIKTIRGAGYMFCPPRDTVT